MLRSGQGPSLGPGDKAHRVRPRKLDSVRLAIKKPLKYRLDFFSNLKNREFDKNVIPRMVILVKKGDSMDQFFDKWLI